MYQLDFLKESDEVIWKYITGIYIFKKDELNKRMPENFKRQIIIYSGTQQMNSAGGDEGADHKTKYNKKTCIQDVCMIPKSNTLFFFFELNLRNKIVVCFSSTNV